MGPDSDRSEIASDDDTSGAARAVGRRRKGRHSVGARPTSPAAAGSLVPPPSWVTALAFAMVVVPFGIVLVRLALAPGQHLYLPDDLALIDLHTRRALQWKQQLGVFDHNGWNHPGPGLLLRALPGVPGPRIGCQGHVRGSHPDQRLGRGGLCGRGAAAEHTGTSAVGRAVGLCPRLPSGHRRAGLDHLLGGCARGFGQPLEPDGGDLPPLAVHPAVRRGHGPVGAVVVGAVLVGSFIVQTNISALILVAALLVVALATWALTVVADRREGCHRAGAGGGGGLPARWCSC